MVLPKDWVSLVMEPRNANLLKRTLHNIGFRCEEIIKFKLAIRWTVAFPGNQLGVDLLSNYDSFQALLMSPDPQLRVLAQEAKKLFDQVTFEPELRRLPFDIQDVIVKYALTFDHTILEFGALYSNPRGHALGLSQRKERRRHLAILFTCEDYHREIYLKHYLEKNQFAFLDLQGLACFLKRIGDRYDTVRSIMLISPQLNETDNIMPQVSPAIALPLFTNLRELILIEGTMLDQYHGVNFSMEYYYKLAELRPSLKKIEVAEVRGL